MQDSTINSELSSHTDLLRHILGAGDRYGQSTDGAGKRVLVEFVSTNPNGPISVAGGRSAALGDAIASLLTATGFDVTREFYVNDAINPAQMDNFGKSVLHRYRQLLSRKASLSAGGPAEAASNTDDPDWLYAGDYVTDIARTILAEYGSKFEDSNIDDPQTVRVFRSLAQTGMIEMQKSDLAAFGTTFDNWYSEASLHDSGRVRGAVKELAERGCTYEKDGAVWFASTAMGDDNDRVLVRANGTPTYIAGDAAYHKDKFDRGFDLAVDVWGADHAGYIARTVAAVAALGYDPQRLQILLYRPVRIVKDGELVKASSRRGDMLELRSDLIDEIGPGAARFFYLMRSGDTELDIDIDLARRTDRQNPYFCVQEAYARLAQVMERREADGVIRMGSEVDLVRKLSEYPGALRDAAQRREPEKITAYLRELSMIVHTFCDSADEDADPHTTNTRAHLAESLRIVLRNALAILGVSTPEGTPR